MKKGMVLVSTFMLVAFLAAFPAVSYGTTYEELVRTYIEKEELREQPGTEIIGLKSAKADVYELWESLVNEKDPLGKIRISRRIIEVIADGDISEWDMIGGFTGSEGYSKSVMVFQASLIRIASLIELDNEKDAWLANQYARELFKTSRTYKIIYNTSGREALDAGSELHVAGGQEWVDNRGGLIWKIKDSGILPFDIAHLNKVRGYITGSRAVYEKAIFLDASGRPVSSGGKYAWIWDSGKVYILRDGERNTSNISGRDNSPASPGNTVGAPSPGGDPDDGDNGDDSNDNGDDGNDNGDDGDDNCGSRSGLGDGTNPGAGSGNNNAGGSAGGTGTDNPGEN